MVVIYADCGVLQDLFSHEDKRKKYIIVLYATPFSVSRFFLHVIFVQLFFFKPI